MLLRRTLQVAVLIYIPFYTVACIYCLLKADSPGDLSSLFIQSEIPLSVEGMPKALIVNDTVAHKKYPFSIFQTE